MARNKTGGLNKLLNFIGLVDDEDTRDTYGDEYSSDNYGRRAAYTPPRQNVRNSATPRTRQAAQPRAGQPAQARASRYDAGASRYDAGTSRYESQNPYGRGARDYDDYRPAARSRFDSPDYGAPRSQRQPSRYSQQPDDRYAAPPAPRANMPARAPRVSARSRTVMYSLRTLEDCCEVIDQLIANNTVVLTMDELDGRLLQRAVDTLSGAVFALHASIRKASDKTYLVAPMSVEINEAYDMEKRF